MRFDSVKRFERWLISLYKGNCMSENFNVLFNVNFSLMEKFHLSDKVQVSYQKYSRLNPNLVCQQNHGGMQ